MRTKARKRTIDSNAGLLQGPPNDAHTGETSTWRLRLGSRAARPPVSEAAIAPARAALHRSLVLMLTTKEIG